MPCLLLWCEAKIAADILQSWRLCSLLSFFSPLSSSVHLQDAL